jgi:hypothetical protein
LSLLFQYTFIIIIELHVTPVIGWFYHYLSLFPYSLLFYLSITWKTLLLSLKLSSSQYMFLTKLKLLLLLLRRRIYDSNRLVCQQLISFTYKKPHFKLFLTFRPSPFNASSNHTFFNNKCYLQCPRLSWYAWKGCAVMLNTELRTTKPHAFKQKQCRYQLWFHQWQCLDLHPFPNKTNIM